MKKQSRFTTAVLLAALTGALWMPAARAQDLSGRRAPSFSLPDVDFKQHDILDFRGKWLLIEFLLTKTTDCAPCQEVTKNIDGLLKKHGPAKLAAIGIAQTPQENQDTIRGFQVITGTKIPIVFDASMTGIAYFKATPQNPRMDVGHVFLVNPQGNIVKDWAGIDARKPSFAGQVDAAILSGAK